MTNNQAIVFPGQGAQEVGMLRDFDAEYALVQHYFAQASAILGYDLWKVIQENSNNLLDKTIYTQPAVLVADLVIWYVFQSLRPTKISFMAGHSLGEYAALVAAESLTFSDAVFLIDKRARLMQDAVPEREGGTGVILGLTSEEVIQLCQDASTADRLVTAVNFNAPAQTVIAGHKALVEQALTLAKQKGAKRAMLLPISIPVHCELMKTIVPQFSAHLNSISIKSPKIPVIHNVDVATHEHPDDIRDVLARQLYSPVQWVEVVKAMNAEGVNCIIECGPKPTLTNLIKRIDSSINLFSLKTVESLLSVSDTLKNEH